MTKFGWLIKIHTADANSQLFVPDDNLLGTGIVLGRDINCDIVINNPYVSRQHCLIRLNDNVLQIIDLGSTNKVFINGKSIAKNRRTVWAENSALRLGNKAIETEITARRIELKDLPVSTVVIDKYKLKITSTDEENTELVKGFKNKQLFYAAIFNKRYFNAVASVFILTLLAYTVVRFFNDVVNDEKVVSTKIEKPVINNNTTSLIRDSSVFENSVNRVLKLDKKYEHINFGNFSALVIGNNDYQYIDSLENAIMDAEAVADILIKNYKFKVTEVINGTRNDILSKLDYMRDHLTYKDNFLIFFAGHGLYDPDSDRGYWLPVDAKLNTRANWISNADITDAVKAIKAKHVIVVADSCYAGSLTRSIEMIQPIFNIDVVERINSLRSRTVLASGGIEPVIDYGGKVIKIGNSEIKHSIFTSVFIDILIKNQNIIDGAGLFSQLRDPVRLNAEQMPIYDNIRNATHEIGGDFLFIRQ